MRIDANFDAALVLKAWTELSSSSDRSANGKLQNMLEGCISRSNGKNIDATLALVRFFQKRRQFEASLLLINKLSIRFPDISIPLIEKMETQMAALDWDYSLDTAIRVINMEPFNVAALRTKGLLHIALFLRAKVDFLCGEYSKAISRLQQILKLFGDTFTEAHLLLAQILVETKQYPKALEYLELSLAQTFTVRERPMYHLLKGIILKHQNKLSEAHQCFLYALQLLGGMSTSLQFHDFVSQTDNTLSSSDKMTLYIELIYVLRDIGDTQGIFESERILQYAAEEFSDTPEIGRLVIAHSQLMLEKCNVSEAISLLSTIKPDQPYFIQARTHLANIYLRHQKDRSAFSKCFKELVEARPESKSFLMLGEAYLSIQGGH
ncbi:GH22333 [Drosophila grimshawi]|uniref:GH22333 n=1 Tax=Drosophila grimshawi TaxID=7222 RepID=B4JYV3_DROGR|nr:GH22333 [Drosophila grimshawi]